MSRWQLEPEGIRQVLTEVEEDLAAMDTAWSVDSLEELMGNLDAAGPAVVDVRNALIAVLNAQSERLGTMGMRVSAGLMGVESALACFAGAQEGMLAQCQSQMLASAGSGDFGWWFGSPAPVGAV